MQKNNKKLNLVVSKDNMYYTRHHEAILSSGKTTQKQTIHNMQNMRR